MKRLLALLLVLSAGYLTSCTSEYEERLTQGMALKNRLTAMQQSASVSGSTYFTQEIREIREEIKLLAKISGNEELFLQQVYGQSTSSSWFGSQK
jgi:hypothetical protein